MIFAPRVIAVAFALVGLVLPALAQASGDDPRRAQRSGFDDMGRDAQAMQRDDGANPGMLAVLEGEGLWQTGAGPEGKSCASCHGDASGSMAGVAARYPAFDETAGQPITLEGRIRQCRAARQHAAPFAWESPDLLALSALVARQSRGVPVAPPADPRLRPAREAGRALYTSRRGQLNLACSACHDSNAGERLAGNIIPQGHPNGYPLYRLEWQALGSLGRRLRNCMVGVRAEPFPYGSPELVALEAFLFARAKGMAVEAPAVRP